MTRSRAIGAGVPGDVDIRTADQLRSVIASAPTDEKDNRQLRFANENGDIAEVVLTPGLAETFLDVLRLISSGKGFHVIPFQAELSTQQAADFLNVSRPYFITLLEEGRLPFTKVGRHRRVKAEDLFAFKDKTDKERDSLLTALAQEDAEYL